MKQFLSPVDLGRMFVLLRPKTDFQTSDLFIQAQDGIKHLNLMNMDSYHVDEEKTEKSDTEKSDQNESFSPCQNLAESFNSAEKIRIEDFFYINADQSQFRPGKNWRKYIRHNIHNPDALFSFHRTHLFLHAYREKNPFVLRLLEGTPIFLALNFDIYSSFSRKEFENLLRYPYVCFMVSARLMACLKSTFLSEESFLQRIQGVITESKHFLKDWNQNSMSSRLFDRFSLSVEEIEHLSDRTNELEFPKLNIWQKIWGFCFLHKEFSQALCFIERADIKNIFKKCSSIYSFSILALENKTETNQNSPVFSAGKVISLDFLHHFRWLQHLDLSWFFFQEPHEPFFFEMTNVLSGLKNIKSISLPISFFAYPPFFKMILDDRSEDLKTGTFDQKPKKHSLFDYLISLNLFFGYFKDKDYIWSWCDPTLLRQNRLESQSLRTFAFPLLNLKEGEVSKDLSLGFEQAFFFLTRPCIQKRIQHLKLEGILMDESTIRFFTEDSASFSQYPISVNQNTELLSHEKNEVQKEILEKEKKNNSLGGVLAGFQNLTTICFGEVLYRNPGFCKPEGDFRSHPQFEQSVYKALKLWADGLRSIKALQNVRVENETVIDMFLGTQPAGKSFFEYEDQWYGIRIEMKNGHWAWTEYLRHMTRTTPRTTIDFSRTSSKWSQLFFQKLIESHAAFNIPYFLCENYKDCKLLIEFLLKRRTDRRNLTLGFFGAEFKNDIDFSKDFRKNLFYHPFWSLVNVLPSLTVLNLISPNLSFAESFSVVQPFSRTVTIFSHQENYEIPEWIKKELNAKNSLIFSSWSALSY